MWMQGRQGLEGCRVAVVAALLFLPIAIAPALAREDEQAGSLSEGKQLYQQACASCHGADARGRGPVAPALVKAPTDLTRLTATHAGVFPHDEFIAVVSGERPVSSHGTRQMPVWSQRFGPSSGPSGVASIYARRRLEMLADYLESVQRFDDGGSAAPP